MDIKIISEKTNPLLARKEYVFEVAHPAGPTPKRDDVRKALADALKVPKDRLILEWMRARFGTQHSRGSAHAYDTKEAVTKVVREHILIRNGLKEKPQKGAAAAAPAAEAKPAEKPKAEAKPAEAKHPEAKHAEAKPAEKPKAEKKE